MISISVTLLNIEFQNSNLFVFFTFIYMCRFNLIWGIVMKINLGGLGKVCKSVGEATSLKKAVEVVEKEAPKAELTAFQELGVDVYQHGSDKAKSMYGTAARTQKFLENTRASYDANSASKLQTAVSKTGGLIAEANSRDSVELTHSMERLRSNIGHADDLKKRNPINLDEVDRIKGKIRDGRTLTLDDEKKYADYSFERCQDAVKNVKEMEKSGELKKLRRQSKDDKISVPSRFKERVGGFEK